MTKTVRVGIMPGKIEEYAVEEGMTISQVLELAGLSAEGYDVKVDGAKVNPAFATITSGTNLILLVKQLKGN
jgi:sulfur carrier protein ThiS